MKKCPYCGYSNDDERTNCERCCAGLPEDGNKPEVKQEEPEHDRVPRRKTRS